MLLAAGCSGAAPAAAPSPAPTPTMTEPTLEATPPPTAEPTSTPTPTPTPDPLAPLTGEPVADHAVLERPVAAAKIDNARPARPQQGLGEADVVFEELVEGGGTRFLALYQSVDPGLVGPVRSGRDVDAALLPAFSPVLGISGAAAPTYAVLRAAGLLVFEEGQANAFARDSTRRAPYNLYASVAMLWAAGTDLPAAAPPWAIDDQVPAGGAPAAEVRLHFAPQASARWTWDPAAQAWLRAQDGAAHLLADGVQVDADNVVIARMAVTNGGGVDSAGSPTVDIAVAGEGDALVLRDGQQFAARWRKTSPNEQLEWLTADRQPLPLDRGRTWVELVPTGAAVEVTPPPPA